MIGNHENPTLAIKAIPETMTNPTPNPAATLLRHWRTMYPVIADNRPLAIGIHKEFRAAYPELSYVVVRNALFRHTNSPRYLAALATPGAQRHDLAGQPIEPVSDTHRMVAADKLAKLQQRQRQAKPQQAPAKPTGSPGRPTAGKPMPTIRHAHSKPTAPPTAPRTGRSTLSLRRTAPA